MTNFEAWEGFLAINKPVGISSFGVIPKLRKLTGQKKIGHAGTLDPFASGLLILALGRTYTRQIERFQEMPKKYQVTVVLGLETATLDITGQISLLAYPKEFEQKSLADLEAKIRSVLPRFMGELSQIPPQFSAKKHQGQRAYQLARAGKVADLAPSLIYIYDLKLLKTYHQLTMGLELPHFDLEISCSKGTYVRSLARDIGQALGTAACCQALTRTAIGINTVEQAYHFEEINLETLPQIKTRLFTSINPENAVEITL